MTALAHTLSERGGSANAWQTLANVGLVADRGVGNPPLLSQICDFCGHPFATIKVEARFCSDKHRSRYWREVRKRNELIESVMTQFSIADSERWKVELAVYCAPSAFYAFASWNGWKYQSRTYQWRLA